MICITNNVNMQPNAHSLSRPSQRRRYGIDPLHPRLPLFPPPPQMDKGRASSLPPGTRSLLRIAKVQNAVPSTKVRGPRRFHPEAHPHYFTCWAFSARSASFSACWNAFSHIAYYSDDCARIHMFLTCGRCTGPVIVVLRREQTAPILLTPSP